MHRSDESGTTENFTDYLEQAGEGAWSHPADKVWPIQSGEGANGTSGMIAAVGQGDGSIGYADLSQAGDLTSAKIKVGSAYVAPSAEGAAKALEASPLEDGRPASDLAVKVDRTSTEAGAYPLLLASYLIACPTYDDAKTADIVKGVPQLRRLDRGPAGGRRQRRLRSAPGVAPASRPRRSSTPSRRRADETPVSSTVTRTRSPRRRLGDLVFSGAAFGAAMTILVALAGVAIFLIIEGIPALGAEPSDLNGKPNLLAYTAPLVFGTLLGGPDRDRDRDAAGHRGGARGLALRAEAAGRRRSATWSTCSPPCPASSTACGAIGFLGPRLVPLYEWLDQHLGWLPFFAGPASTTGRTILTAAIVLAIMILPIITAISREIFAQTPRLNEEAALALGATRWEMIRLSVLPYARSGIVSAVMLGLGRAMGETMAVAMVLSASGVVTFNLISSTNPSTIAANIALTFADATGLKVNALVASGLVLFVITFVVNFAARCDRRPRRQVGVPMTTTAPPRAETQRHEHVPLRHPRLPRWAPLLVAAMAASAARSARAQPRLGRRRLGDRGGRCCYLVGLPLWSRVVENRRAAVDRLVTSLIWVALVIAFIPLVSLLWPR